MVLPCAAAGFWAAVGLQCCMIIAACLSHALRSVSAVIMTLLANHINLASHSAGHNSDFIGAGSTCKTKKLRVEVKNLPLSLGPVQLKRSLVHHATSLFQ